MAATIIKNGYVFDPLTGIDGEVKDIFIMDGKVVASLSGADSRDATIIDASGAAAFKGTVSVDGERIAAGVGRPISERFAYTAESERPVSAAICFGDAA